MNKLQWAILLSIIGNVLAWFHMNGQFMGSKYEWFTKSNWEEYLLAFSSTTVLECHTTTLDTTGPSDQLVLVWQQSHLGYLPGHCLVKSLR